MRSAESGTEARNDFALAGGYLNLNFDIDQSTPDFPVDSHWPTDKDLDARVRLSHGLIFSPVPGRNVYSVSDPVLLSLEVVL